MAIKWPVAKFYMSDRGWDGGSLLRLGMAEQIDESVVVKERF